MRIGYGRYLQSLLNYEEKNVLIEKNKKLFDIFHSLYLKSNLCVHAFHFQKSKFTIIFFNLNAHISLAVIQKFHIEVTSYINKKIDHQP